MDVTLNWNPNGSVLLLKKWIVILLGLLLASSLLLYRINERMANRREVLRVYSAFRDRMNNRQFDHAAELFINGYQDGSAENQLAVRMNFVMHPSFALSERDFVHFSGTKAHLRVGRIGSDSRGIIEIEFASTSEGWRLTGQVVPIVD
jgi:hypothetical protein